MEQDDLNELNEHIAAYMASNKNSKYGSAARKRIDLHEFYKPEDTFTTAVNINRWLKDMIKDVDEKKMKYN